MKNKMVHSVRALALFPLAVLCIASVAAQAQTPPLPDPPAVMHQGPMQPGTNGSESMKQMMMSGMDSMQNMPRSGDTDKDFAMMMKMHHQQGVDKAKIELEQGKSPEMKALAKQIISAQQKEILRFDQWLTNQK
jgi:uncharacterized protein (DUF305 family)